MAFCIRWGRCGVAVAVSLLLERLGWHAVLEVFLPVGQREQLFVGRAVVGGAIATAALAPGGDLDAGEAARAVVVQVQTGDMGNT